MSLHYYTESRIKSTMRVTLVMMPIMDRRAASEDYSLDRQGFKLVQHNTTLTDFVAAARSDRRYAEEMAELISDTTGAFFGTCLSLGVRLGRNRSDYQKADDDKPARFPDADFTTGSARKVLDRLGAGLGTYSRCAFFNVWHIFSDLPQDFSLAVCDARTVMEADEEEAEAILDFEGKQTALRSITTVYRRNAADRWVYFSNMAVGEALIFKAWDSDPERPQRVPHGSLANPLAGPATPSRSSIEARVGAFYQWPG